jgi:hypothetical protein
MFRRIRIGAAWMLLLPAQFLDDPTHNLSPPSAASERHGIGRFAQWRIGFVSRQMGF